jgi:hypothetical protein
MPSRLPCRRQNGVLPDIPEGCQSLDDRFREDVRQFGQHEGECVANA